MPLIRCGVPSSVGDFDMNSAPLRRGYLFAWVAEILVRILRQKPHGVTITGPVWMIADADIQRAAKELVERYGNSAMSVAQDRIAEFSAKHDQSGMNIALRVLSALEVLLEHRGE